MSISVLMSVYGEEKADFLDTSLRSVWDDQMLKPYEIVLIQDGPVDKGLSNVIKSWENKLGNKFKLIVNEKNLGLTKSLNRGIPVASGTYIARMDSDDISTPIRFKRQVEFLEENPEIDVVGGSVRKFNAFNSNLVEVRFPVTPKKAHSYIYRGSPLAHPAVMMRRKIFDCGLRYNEKYRTSQDIAFWFDVIADGFKIDNIDEILLLYRQDDQIYKRRSKQKAGNELKIYMNGIRRLYGPFTWRYIMPLARYCFRLMPTGFIKYIYESNFFRKVIH